MPAQLVLVLSHLDGLVRDGFHFFFFCIILKYNTLDLQANQTSLKGYFGVFKYCNCQQNFKKIRRNWTKKNPTKHLKTRIYISSSRGDRVCDVVCTLTVSLSLSISLIDKISHESQKFPNELDNYHFIFPL